MTPRYQSLFQQIGRIEGGVKFLVDMRADLLVSVTIMHSVLSFGECVHSHLSVDECVPKDILLVNLFAVICMLVCSW